MGWQIRFVIGEWRWQRLWCSSTWNSNREGRKWMVEVGRGQGWDPFYHSRGSGRRVVQGSDSVADGGSGFQCHNFTKLKHEVKKGRATKLKRKVKKGRGRDTHRRRGSSVTQRRAAQQHSGVRRQAAMLPQSSSMLEDEGRRQLELGQTDHTARWAGHRWKDYDKS
jgi:hypothetical protein